MLKYDTDDKNKSLNYDWKLKQDNDSGLWDLEMKDFDVVNVADIESLRNGICIAIMVRYEELWRNKTYEEFGCRIHELIKANKSNMVRYKISKYIENSLKKIRRIQSVNNITVTDNPDSNFHSYKVFFDVTSINDETVQGSVIV